MIVAVRALGIGCDAVIVKGTKQELLDWVSWAIESGAIHFPVRSGPIHWPKLGLEDILHRCRLA